MASSIDPITGAPLVGSYPPDFNIDQIPLDSQPIPLKDLGATRPANRRLTYPDDAPAMTALQGFGHKDQNAALQTYAPLAPVNVGHPVNAADVYIRGSDVSGGGGGNSPVAYQSKQIDGALGTGSTYQVGSTFVPVSVLYAITIGFGGYFSDPNFYAVFDFWLQDADSGTKSFRIGSVGVPVFKNPSTATYLFGGAFAPSMPFPVDLAGIFGGPELWQLFVNSPAGILSSQCNAGIWFT